MGLVRTSAFNSHTAILFSTVYKYAKFKGREHFPVATLMHINSYQVQNLSAAES